MTDTEVWKTRLLQKTKPDGSCVIWTGSKTSSGYGRTKWEGKYYYVHRAMWDLFRGPIPDGLVIDHLCRNRACVNLNHLELVTPAENSRRGVSHNGSKTHCPKGHPYSGDNIIWIRRYNPKRRHIQERRCRTCYLEQKRARRQREKWQQNKT